MKEIADFFFELGMLKKTPRTGFQFLGTGGESVAEHTFRTAMIGYTLARLAEADACRVVMLCLCHDLAETRTGDHNYVNKRYVTAKERDALADLTAGLPFRDDILDLVGEYKGKESLEARLAHDADQLDLICELSEQLALGNRYASLWLEHAKKRLVTEVGARLAGEIEETDPSSWWYEGNDSWWS